MLYTLTGSQVQRACFAIFGILGNNMVLPGSISLGGFAADISIRQQETDDMLLRKQIINTTNCSAAKG